MKELIENLKTSAKKLETENRQFFSSLRKKQPKNIDRIIKEIHNNVFSQIECLDCANCCKSISPILRDKDISRICRHLKIKPSDFTEKYLLLDEENDYVFSTQPCPFLQPDNYCSIYSVRPKACSEYPLTRQPNILSRLNITLKNSYYCPAILPIVEQLKQEIKLKRKH